MNKEIDHYQGKEIEVFRWPRLDDLTGAIGRE